MIPEIRLDKYFPTLYVKGEPFFARAGEIHNSSASDLEFMKEHIWPALRELNMNTVIVPLYWETMEPEEGRYDFTLLDGVIDQAREEKLHLVFLWFGLWKNAESMYVPGWMKRDSETYYRVRKVTGEPINTISPLCEAAVRKDAQAFAAVMAHIREKDEEESTVIFMQVENEVGVLKTDRDYGPEAEAVFAGEIPEALARALQVEGTWNEAFGEDAGEAFMAWHFASAIQKITEAGQAAYPLPCYANAWLKQHPWYPGSYPSGGPVREMHAIWKTAAPSLFALGPDIYVPYVPQILDTYGYEGNPLVVPEVRKDAVTSSYCLYAFAAKQAICYSPFGIEELALDPSEVDKPPMAVMIALNIDPSAFEIAGSKAYLARTYQMVQQMQPLMLEYRGTDRMQSYVRKSDTDYGTYLRFEKYNVAVSYAPRQSEKPLGAGVIFELAPDRFLIGGMMCSLEFTPKPGVNKKAEILRLEEGELTAGEWKRGRILNGDEKMSVQLADMPGWILVELFEY